MKQQFQLWSLPVAIGLAAMVVALPIECTYARGRGGGGFARSGFARGGFGHGDFGRGGFSREGPAAAGGFASHPESMLGHERTFPSTAAAGQANRMEYGQHSQASRQQEANALQSNREQAARNLQSNAQQYRRAYPYGRFGYPAWDAGAGWAAGVGLAAGAAIGAAAASPESAAPATAGIPVSSAGPPCAVPTVVPADGTQYFRCGTLWYTQAYGPSGPSYVQVAPPSGY